MIVPCDARSHDVAAGLSDASFAAECLSTRGSRHARGACAGLGTVLTWVLRSNGIRVVFKICGLLVSVSPSWTEK